MSRVVILGGGPAGLGAALGLARRGLTPTVVEAGGGVGGNAGSFTLHGVPVDYGSHRLHPATDPEILDELRGLLGDELVERPRHGRIRLGDRWVHFPLRAVDLTLNAPPAFAWGAAKDVANKLWKRGLGHGGAAVDAYDTFASVLLAGLGPTACRDFYFPLARKMWGLEPEAISAEQARRRVSSATLGAVVRRLVPGERRGGGRASRGRFFYPRGGFGRISEALGDAAVDHGARILLRTRARRVVVDQGEARVEVEGPEGTAMLSCDHVWSTLPMGVLARMMDPAPPPQVLAAAGALEHRAMVLVYLVVGQDRLTGYDAHYVPTPRVPFTRLSEPKNYSGRTDLVGVTVLCAEIPCAVGDGSWTADDATLAAWVVEGMARLGLPAPAPLLEVAVRRLPAAYPVYPVGYEEHFRHLDAWVSALPRALSFGRLGLHAHDNTHHALAMARAAVACLGDDGRFDDRRWAVHRRAFEAHVVED